MTSGRNAGSVACVVMAMLSLVVAVIWAIMAGSAATLVSNEPGDGEFNHETSDVGAPAFERWSDDGAAPFDDATGCTRDENSPPDQDFLACVANTEKGAREDASAWAAVVAARQTDVQMKGNMAVTFGLIGLTFAVCAVALGGGRPATPQAAAPARPATDEPVAQAQATVPAQEAGPADGDEPAQRPAQEQHASIEWGRQHRPD